jgi:hypothetical protein
MAEKEKPIPRIVKTASRAMKHPETVSLRDIKSMGARIMDDQKNDPEPHVFRYLGRKANPRGGRCTSPRR